MRLVFWGRGTHDFGMSKTLSAGPRVGLIGGSGLGNALLAQVQGQAEEYWPETPFGKASAPLLLFDYQGVPVAFLARHGIGHVTPPSAVPYRANIFSLKLAGCRWVVASGAVGSLREEIRPRDLVVVDQAIDKTTGRDATFFDTAGGGAVHVEFSEPMCEELRQIILETTRSMSLAMFKVHERGTYVCMNGPAFSTRAESLMHREWGGDVIGMTAMPEAKLAREAELSYALIALATDYDCWRPHKPAVEGQSKLELLKEIISHLNAATENGLKLIQAALPAIWAQREKKFASQRSLELAIWSDKSRISEKARKMLEPIWGEYVK